MTENELCQQLADALFLRCNDDDSWSQTAREKLLPIIRSYANALVAAAVSECKQACIINGDSCGDSHTDCHGSDANCMSFITPESAAKELERIKAQARLEEHDLHCPYCRCCDGCRKLCPRRSALEAAKEK